MAVKWIHINMFISVFIGRFLAQVEVKNTIDFIHANSENYRINLLDIFDTLVVYLASDCHLNFRYHLLKNRRR